MQDSKNMNRIHKTLKVWIYLLCLEKYNNVGKMKTCHVCLCLRICILGWIWENGIWENKFEERLGPRCGKHCILYWGTGTLTPKPSGNSEWLWAPNQYISVVRLSFLVVVFNIFALNLKEDKTKNRIKCVSIISWVWIC